MLSSGYDRDTFCNPALDPERDFHRGPVPDWGDTKGRAIVYVAVNVNSDGRMYVGITEKGIQTRNTGHLWSAANGSQTTFHRAIRKHGPESFNWYVIEVWPTYEDALKAERRMIRHLKPRYNITEGGGGVKGLVHSAASKAKMSAAKKGKPSVWTKTKMPQSVKDALADACRARKGQPISEKARAAILANAKMGNAARRKRVVCLNTGIEYESNTAAGKAYKLTTGQITRLCKLGCATRKGLRFAYRNASA